MHQRIKTAEDLNLPSSRSARVQNFQTRTTVHTEAIMLQKEHRGVDFPSFPADL